MKKLFLLVLLISLSASVFAVDYLGELEYYSQYDRTRVSGNIVNSKKEQYSNGQVVYRYYYDNGWVKSLSISKCAYCFGSGRCNNLHMGFGICPNCGNSYKCRFCGATGTSISFMAQNPSEGAYIGTDGVLRYTGGGGSSYSNGSSSGSSNSNSSSSSSAYTKCKECGGGGGCRKCNGTGQIYSPSPYHGVSSYQKCPSCNGSGKCYMCYGTGRY